MKQYICVITCEKDIENGCVTEARFCSTFEEAVSYGSEACLKLKPLAADFWIYQYCGFDSTLSCT